MDQGPTKSEHTKPSHASHKQSKNLTDNFRMYYSALGFNIRPEHSSGRARSRAVPAGTFRDAINRFDTFANEHLIEKCVEFAFVTAIGVRFLGSARAIAPRGPRWGGCPGPWWCVHQAEKVNAERCQKLSSRGDAWTASIWPQTRTAMMAESSRRWAKCSARRYAQTSVVEFITNELQFGRVERIHINADGEKHPVYIKFGSELNALNVSAFCLAFISCIRLTITIGRESILRRLPIPRSGHHGTILPGYDCGTVALLAR
jgi:hypothetical protein